MDGDEGDESPAYSLPQVDTLDRIANECSPRPPAGGVAHPGVTSVLAVQGEDNRHLRPYGALPTRPRTGYEMREILSTEQPCILCGMALQVVILRQDEITGAEEIERVDLPHNDSECRRMLNLYPEVWPAWGARRL